MVLDLLMTMLGVTVQTFRSSNKIANWRFPIMFRKLKVHGVKIDALASFALMLEAKRLQGI